MPYEILSEDGGKRITVNFWGLVTLSDIFDSFKDRFSDIEAIKRLRVNIADYTDVDEVRVTGAEVRELLPIFRDLASKNNSAILVVIAPTDLKFGLSRIWDLGLYDLACHHNVFRSREDAMEWIAEIELAGSSGVIKP